MDNSLDLVTVLLYERKPRMAIALAKVMQKSKLIGDVIRIDNPQKIVEINLSARAEVVVVDVDRPGCDIISLCKVLAEQTTARVVLLSVENVQSNIKEALEAGAHAVITWPFKPRDLVLAVLHAANSARSGSIANLEEAELETRSDMNLNTRALSPLIDWAAKPADEQVSPRLRPKPADGPESADSAE